MPPADNTRFLLAAAAERARAARARAEAALDAASKRRDPVTVLGIAQAAGVSRSWLYTQPDLVAAIQRLRQRQPTASRTGPQPASTASLQRRLEASLDRNKQLRGQVTTLTAQLEAAHGEIRRLRTGGAQDDAGKTSPGRER